MLTSFWFKDGVLPMGAILQNAKIIASPKLCISGDDLPRPFPHHIAMAKEQRPSNYLRNWREYRGLTQTQLAEKMKPKTTGAVISLIESGERRLSDKWAHRIGPALNIRPGWLLDHDPESLDSTVLEIWAGVPIDKQEHAINILKTFSKRSKREG